MSVRSLNTFHHNCPYGRTGKAMSLNQVVLTGAEGGNSWEADLIRGALWYHGIPSRVVREEDSMLGNPRQLVVNISTCHQNRTENIVVRAGRRLTYAFLAGEYRPTSQEVFVYGEPYVFLVQVAKNLELLKGYQGKALLGPLLSPNEYKHPPLEGQATLIRLMTSIGCRKTCRYCPYGPNYCRLYADEFTRRSRQWQDIAQEMDEFLEAGIDQIAFLADQFLAIEPEENSELQDFISFWRSRRSRHPKVKFTVSPAEVLSNLLLLKEMSTAFEVLPILSIDSLSSDTLCQFGQDFDISMALDAVEAFRELRLPIRINYIFIRPGVTKKKLKLEFENLRILTSKLDYLPPNWQLLIAHDIFSVQLKFLQGAPIAEDNAMVYDEEAHTQLMRVTSVVQQAIKNEIKCLQTGKGGGGGLLARIIDAGASMLIY